MKCPAARLLDPVTHDGKTPSGLIGGPPVPTGKGPVIIEGGIAAHKGCMAHCTGFSSAGPKHPPGMPPTSATIALSGGRKVVVEPPPSAKAQADEILKKKPPLKELQISVVSEKGGTSMGVATRVIKFKIVDPATDATAQYRFSSGGGDLSIGLPVDTDEWGGGEPASFWVPSDTTFEDFEGYAIMSEWHFFFNQFGTTRFTFGRRPDGSYLVKELEINRDDQAEPNLGGTVVRLGKVILERKAGSAPPEKLTPGKPPGVAPIQNGSSTVYIHSKPAARWLPAKDNDVACKADLGLDLPPYNQMRTVLIGD